MKTLPYPRLIDHPDEIASLLRAVIGAHIRLVNCRVINQDEDYCVLFARLSQPDIEVVVKLAGSKAKMASKFDRTAAGRRLRVGWLSLGERENDPCGWTAYRCIRQDRIE